MSAHWADQIAEQIVSSGKHKPYWVDDMKTPSGRVHIGSVRAVLTHEMIYKALLDKNKKASFSYVLEDHDPFDKVPQYLDYDVYAPHLGKPLYQVPSPDPKYDSYGRYFGEEYRQIFNLVGAHPKVIWGSQLYLSGKMNSVVAECLDKADKIRSIYRTLYHQDKPAGWLPINMRCAQCGKLSTTVASSWDGEKVTYHCQPDAVSWTSGCDYRASDSPFDGKAKLLWKVEWPAKWKVIGVTIEGAGKDHASAGGSFDFARLMCDQVLEYPFPFAFGHEFFLTGGRKMSSSKGIGSSAQEIASIIPAYLIRFLIANTKYNRAIDFDPHGPFIPNAFDQYDQAATAFWSRSNPKLARTFELSQTSQAEVLQHFLPRFRDVALHLQDPKVDLTEKFASIKGSPLNQQELKTLKHRAKYARIWLHDYAPKDQVLTITSDVPPEAANLSAQQKQFLQAVISLLNETWSDPQKLQQALFDLAKSGLGIKPGFQAIYLSLIGKPHGPKAAWLLLNNQDLAIERFKEVAGQPSKL